LNLCASFEAVNCRDAIITNIFEKSFGEVEKDLLELYRIEKKWFIDNITEIREGRISTCKLKNNCYRNP